VLRVTADSNVYISALNFGGVPEKLLDSARAGEIQLTVSDAILDEVSRVLADKSAYLVTGDRHLLKLGRFEATEIVSPAGLLAIMAQAG